MQRRNLRMISRGFDLKPAYTQLKEFSSRSEASVASLGVMQSVSRFHTLGFFKPGFAFLQGA
jgi:hypothetical protein